MIIFLKDGFVLIFVSSRAAQKKTTVNYIILENNPKQVRAH